MYGAKSCGAKWRLGCALLAVLLLASCNRKPKSVDVLAPVEVIDERTSLAGRWRLEVTEGDSRFSAALLDVAPDGEKFKVSLAAVANSAGSATLEQTAAAGNELRTTFNLSGQKLQFEGYLRDSRVWGMITVPNGTVLPAMLIPTNLITLHEVKPQPVAGHDALQKALASPDRAAALETFVQEFPESPEILNAYRDLLRSAKSEKKTAEQVSGLLQKFRDAAGRWGPRFQTFASVDAAGILAASDYLPELAQQQVDLASKELKEDAPEGWRVSLGDTDVRVGRVDKGLAVLEPMYAKYPTNPLIGLAVARGRELQGNLDGALELYTRLAVLPGVEAQLLHTRADSPERLPSRSAARVWAARHGSEEGFAEHMAGAFHELVSSYAKPREAGTAPPDGARVVVVELFTGTSCPGCVAADVAAGAAQSAYPPEKLLVLRYHVHVPAPDPMTIQAGGDRYQIYEAPGTPTVVVNGKTLANIGGILDQTPQAFERLTEMIDRRISDDTDVRVELTAQPAGDRIRISAAVNGLRPIPEKARLRLAIVEDGIDFLAPNGIRVHEGVVRSMPAGAKGIPVREGKLVFSDSISIAEMKDDITSDLDYAEERYDLKFPVRPLSLAHLRLVAFVQDDATKEILQAASIPLTETAPPTSSEPQPAAIQADPESAPATPDDLEAPAEEAAPATPE